MPTQQTVTQDELQELARMGIAATNPRADMHTISLFVNNKPGVLVRVALVFARRGYNIESLVVSAGADAQFSRMTITCSGNPQILEQIIKQLAKLVDVVHAIDHTGQEAIESEIALVKIRVPMDQRTEIFQVAEAYKAKIVDYTDASVVLRLHGDSTKVDAAVAVLSKFDILELVRSGKILMARGQALT